MYNGIQSFHITHTFYYIECDDIARSVCFQSKQKGFEPSKKKSERNKKYIHIRRVCPCVVNDKRIQCNFHFISFIRNQAIRFLFVHCLTVCVRAQYTSSFYSWFVDAAVYTATDFIIISFNSFHVRWTFFFHLLSTLATITVANCLNTYFFFSPVIFFFFNW